MEATGKRVCEMHTCSSCARSLGLVHARASDSCLTLSLRMVILSSWAVAQRLAAHFSAAQSNQTAVWDHHLQPRPMATAQGHCTLRRASFP